MEADTVAVIRSMLADVEASEGVRICLAVESGSRAWGFPSADSDYDVRFIYVRHPDSYLSIEEVRDVIERPLTDNIDLSGWDIRKALHLFRKSNPPLLEWLQSPMVYAERPSFTRQMRSLVPHFYAPNASVFHYLHMARGNFREYLRGDVVWRKKYLYVLRPLLALRWIESGRGAVPMEFSRLVEALVDDTALRAAIEDLLAAKRAGGELDEGPRMPEISEFIEAELSRFEVQVTRRADMAPPVDELNALFRDTLAEAWSGATDPIG